MVSGHFMKCFFRENIWRNDKRKCFCEKFFWFRPSFWLTFPMGLPYLLKEGLVSVLITIIVIIVIMITVIIATIITIMRNDKDSKSNNSHSDNDDNNKSFSNDNSERSDN